VAQANGAQEEVLAALDRTVGRGTARIEFHESTDPAGMTQLLPRGPVSGLMKHVMKGMETLPNLGRRAVGFIDFAGHRCMLDYPDRSAQATLIVGNRRWEGHPGTHIGGRPKRRASLSPVWLVDLLRGVDQAQRRAEEVLDGNACRRFSVHANVGRADKAVPYDLVQRREWARRRARRSASNLWSDPGRIPLEVWMDGEDQIRRVRCETARRALILTLDLADFAIDQPLDWSRFPSFNEGRKARGLRE